MSVTEIGNEKTSLIVIDDFSPDLTEIIRGAVNGRNYGVDKTTVYPGVRARPSTSYEQQVLAAVVPLLIETYGLDSKRPFRHSAYYSLVALQPGELSMMQRLPHFDSNETDFFAITHYLNEGPHGGTAFFRHRPTGFETVTTARHEEFARAGNAFMQAHGFPDAEYLTASNEHFEIYEQVDYAPNRLVAYPGCMLHSGLIDPAIDISSDPAKGRLTGNFFITFDSRS